MAETIYKRGLTFASTTLADHGDNIATGHIRKDPNTGAEYMLVKVASGQTVTDGACCKASTGQTTTAAIDLSVLEASATTSIVVCANNTGADRTSLQYFWGIVRGRGYALGDGAGIGDGLEFTPGANGVITAIAVGATDSHAGYTISDVAAGTTANAVMWALPSKRAGA